MKIEYGVLIKADAGDVSSGTLMIPSGVTRLAENSIRDIKELYHIDIPQGVTKIGDCAFACCRNLESVTIPESLKDLHHNAFFDCKSLNRIDVDKNNQEYDSDEIGVLYNKDKTMLIIYPQGKPNMSFCIPNSVNQIGEKAFDTFGDVNKLSVITLSDNMIDFSAKVFNKLPHISKIIAKENRNYYSDEDGVLYNGDKSILIFYPRGKVGKSFCIPSGVMRIGEYAFYSCKSIEKIEIPESVVKIEGYAFYACYNLMDFSIPSNVMKIGEAAFSDCYRLDNIVIPVGVKSIQAWTFQHCKSLTKISIPASVTYIGNRAFRDCKSLEKTEIPGDIAKIEDSAFEGCNFVINSPKAVKDRQYLGNEYNENYGDDKKRSETKKQHDVKKPFVFISASSKDYNIAGYVYGFLVENNVNTFFAGDTLKQLGNADYRHQIDNFLDVCDHMIVVTSSSDNAKSPWVEAEWGFFVNEKRSGRKHGNLITITYGDVVISELPPSLRYYEVMNLKDSWAEKLLQYIK